MHPARPHPVPRTTPSGACNYLCPRCNWPWYLCDCAARCRAPRPLIASARSGLIVADGLIAAPAILPDLSAPDRQEIPLTFLTCAWCGGTISAVPCCDGDDREGA